MAQHGSLNCHKMAKNAPNELKFIPDMYFYEFYQIQEDFGEIFKTGRFLAEKRPFSAYLASWFWKKNFHGKCNNTLKNASIDLKINIETPYGTGNNRSERFWEILKFDQIMAYYVRQLSHFWPKNAKNSQKLPPQHT